MKLSTTQRQQLAFLKELRDLGVVECEVLDNHASRVKFSEAKVVAASLEDPLLRVLDDPKTSDAEKRKALAKRRDALLYGTSADTLAE